MKMKQPTVINAQQPMPNQNPFLPIMPDVFEEEEADLEFMWLTVRRDTDTTPEELAHDDKRFSEWSNEGWRMGDFVACAPFVTYIFFREKETPTDEPK